MWNGPFQLGKTDFSGGRCWNYRRWSWPSWNWLRWSWPS
jgi:hypothetical protein